MRGKYSPTVNDAYYKDQEWWHKYVATGNDEWSLYDPEGYDSYGYDEHNRDRAGNYEWDYYPTDNEDWDINYAYEDALDEWRFDGVKPVSR